MSDDQNATDAAPARTFPYTVTLKHPITFAKKEIAELVFQKGKLGHMNGIKIEEGLKADDVLTVAARMCGQPVLLLEQLDIDDAEEVVEIATDFYAAYLAGLKKPSRR